LNYSLHPEAERDLADASDFYRVAADGSVAERFIAEFERVAQLLARHPGRVRRTSEVAGHSRCRCIRTWWSLES